MAELSSSAVEPAPRGRRTELLDPDGLAAAREELGALLVDVVEAGGTVGFLPPVTRQAARAFWTEMQSSVGRGDTVALVARSGTGQVDGCVLLELARQSNGQHRAEVRKLLVHSRARRQGVGRALMTAVEDEARRLGRTTLILDTREGEPAEALYRALGWTEVGRIARFARSADGTLHTTVCFARWL